ncbi:MAG: hypothetical protein A3K10_09605 [Bacteroidetes bacterium RIFCSPLOWO2_12_FULL_31_6]|nr:MAG: hypothetical protein A3K10_09605 [Bacteroidetes bacterium RIFCSPLOWO2_12_FULL_31_6]
MFDEKRYRIIPSLGIVRGEDNYRTDEIEIINHGGWISYTEYNYTYEKQHFTGGRVSIAIILTSNYIGFTFEPYVTFYDKDRTDMGITLSANFGKVN